MMAMMDNVTTTGTAARAASGNIGNEKRIKP